MRYQITTDELVWRKRKVVRMYSISFAIAFIMVAIASHKHPEQYLIPGIATGTICLIVAKITIRRSLARLKRYPVEVTPDAIMLPYRNSQICIPYEAITKLSIQDDSSRPLLTLRIKGFPKIILAGYENMKELIQEIQTEKKKFEHKDACA